MGKTFIVTAGPTNEPIDAVMKITNMSTGALGAKVAETLLSDKYANQVHKIYYVSPKLAKKPNSTDDRLFPIEIETTQDLLNTMRVLLKNPNEHIDAVVHSAAVGDYTGRHVCRAEDLANELLRYQILNGQLPYEAIMRILTHPDCTTNNATKISSYEPNLMVTLDLTPKVISSIKKFSHNTTLIGFKLLEGVSKQELFDVAAKLREKSDADYIIANDLAKIRDGRHPAMIIGEDDNPNAHDSKLLEVCETKDEIAAAIASILLAS